MNQAKIEALYSQRNNHSTLHNEIKAHLETTFKTPAIQLFMKIRDYLDQTYSYKSKEARLNVMRKHEKDMEKWVVAIIAAVIHTKQVQNIQAVVGYIANHLPFTDQFDAAVTAGELLALGHRPNGLYEIKRHGVGKSATVEVNKWKALEKRLLGAFEFINDTHFNPPLIEPPLEVTNNHSCGYHTIQEPCILGLYTMHDGQICLDTINYLNSIEWVLDEDVLAEPEVPSKPLTDPEAHQQFIHMCQQSSKLYKMYRGRPFWFAWQADSRGRLYSHGYHINLQAQEYKKALLSFNKEELLT